MVARGARRGRGEQAAEGDPRDRRTSRPGAIAAASRLAIEAGADFLKTSTGKTAVSATPRGRRDHAGGDPRGRPPGRAQALGRHPHPRRCARLSRPRRRDHGAGLGDAARPSASAPAASTTRSSRRSRARRPTVERSLLRCTLPQEIIRAKRDGDALAEAEIAPVHRRARPPARVSEGQAAAFAMAVFFRGMTHGERVALTRAMTRVRHGAATGRPARPGARQALDRRRRRHGEPGAGAGGRRLRRLRADDLGPRPRPYRRHARQARRHPRLRHRSRTSRLFRTRGARGRLRHHRPDRRPRAGRQAPLRHPRRDRDGRDRSRPDHRLDPVEEARGRPRTAWSWT